MVVRPSSGVGVRQLAKIGEAWSGGHHPSSAAFDELGPGAIFILSGFPFSSDCVSSYLPVCRFGAGDPAREVASFMGDPAIPMRGN
jgi:hypothetical protein